VGSTPEKIENWLSAIQAGHLSCIGIPGIGGAMPMVSSQAWAMVGGVRLEQVEVL
jgi:hypothetical protein